ncbi:unnamed protein product [Dovyalis caffra]|uniref:Uncharacterized protein n=1 Tax=Dovyalis caffra TaxID=77055 RepID=A0AAV1SDV8_9ROSI|nr:unnamed protein product [Dovyalis caffra]
MGIRFVTLMGGQIWIESEGLDKGTVATFIVKLGLCNNPDDPSVHHAASRGRANEGSGDIIGHKPLFRELMWLLLPIHVMKEVFRYLSKQIGVWDWLTAGVSERDQFGNFAYHRKNKEHPRLMALNLRARVTGYDLKNIGLLMKSARKVEGKCVVLVEKIKVWFRPTS